MSRSYKGWELGMSKSCEMHRELDRVAQPHIELYKQRVNGAYRTRVKDALIALEDARLSVEQAARAMYHCNLDCEHSDMFANLADKTSDEVVTDLLSWQATLKAFQRNLSS